MIIVHEHPYLLISGIEGNFWVGQEISGVGRKHF